MKCTKIDPVRESLLKKIIAAHAPAADIVAAIARAGGRAFLVGGAVRDLLLSEEIKDLDIEVHGISLESLQAILSQFGPVSLIGKAFGVLRLHTIDADWSLPRTDSSGRHPQVAIDPGMSIADAFKRRDLTINAMGIDLTTFELVDPWGGCHDLQQKILRAPDAKLFIEDPLRLFRVMQFIGRFDFKPDAQLNEICARMSLEGISVERIEAEFDKLLLKSARPSLGLRWLKAIGRLQEIFPELAATVGVEQEPEWHPEGDVFEHTMQALDAGVPLSYDSSQQKLIALYALICHDLGKAVTTRMIDGRVRSHGHEVDGVPLATALLKRITRRVDLIAAVEKIVRHHMAPGLLPANGAKLSAYKRLATKLAPEVSMELLTKVAFADSRGRNPVSSLPLSIDVPLVEQFLRMAQEAHVATQPEAPILQGRDLLSMMAPGPAMGELLKKAYDIQIDEGIKDKQELIRRVMGKI